MEDVNPFNCNSNFQQCATVGHNGRANSWSAAPLLVTPDGELLHNSRRSRVTFDGVLLHKIRRSRVTPDGELLDFTR